MTIGLTWRRTARRIKRLKQTVLAISPDYLESPDPRPSDALVTNSDLGRHAIGEQSPHQAAGWTRILSRSVSGAVNTSKPSGTAASKLTRLLMVFSTGSFPAAIKPITRGHE